MYHKDLDYILSVFEEKDGKWVVSSNGQDYVYNTPHWRVNLTETALMFSNSYSGKQLVIYEIDSIVRISFRENRE